MTPLTAIIEDQVPTRSYVNNILSISLKRPVCLLGTDIATLELYTLLLLLLEKWFSLHGERAHSLYFCIYMSRLEVSKNNSNEKEETEQTY